MTLEEMKAVAERAAKALENSGNFGSVGIIEEAIVPGEPIPIAAIDNETGEEIVLAVSLL